MSNTATRYHSIDSLRGLCLLSMILFHATWDLVSLFGHPWGWFHSDAALLWQQVTCCLFIAISGFCWNLGKSHLKQGLKIFLLGCGISLVTYFAMPDARILYGVLTLLGSATLLMIPLHPLLSRFSPKVGLLVSGLLFYLTYPIGHGTLAPPFGALPTALYHGQLATFFGFTDPHFFSADYFPLLPWFFMFLCGYFGFFLLKSHTGLQKALTYGIPPLSWLGRHSLILYLIHQPLVYGVLYLFHL